MPDDRTIALEPIKWYKNLATRKGRLGLQPEQLADQCIECGECLEACPQGIPIPEWMKEVHAMLGSKQDE